MKKLLLTLTLLFGLILPAFSSENVIPEKTCLKYTNTIGLYQASDRIVLYKEPNEQYANDLLRVLNSLSLLVNKEK